MKRKKRFIITTLLLINILMLIVTVIPHHHHANGVICMKHDLPVEHQCPVHNPHSEGDSCCDNECITRFHSPIPSLQTNNGPDYVIVAILFTDVIIEHLFRPQEQRLKSYNIFQNSLHGANIPRTFSLRAPPYSAIA